jgi:signal transduction histidine kinase
MRLHNLSRVLLCLIIPLAIPAAIFLPRLSTIGNYTYFRSPEVYIILISTSVIPLLVFSLREKKALLISLLVNVLVLFSFDFLLYRLSSSFGQAPYTILRFIISHLVVFIMFLFINGSLAFLKTLFEYFEARNEKLISQLHKKNQELQLTNQELYELNQEIEVQNEEIKSQSEELLQSQESVMHANVEIERQKKELEEKNHLLETSLGERNYDLLQTNQQLINQNSDLQQFSFTVSHNLRAPVASMKGLLNLYYLSNTDDERIRVIKLFENATNSLDTIIQDLGKIVDIRQNNFMPLEKVCLQSELNLIIQSLSTSISSNEVLIQTDFAITQLISVKAYINSILFNLVSNAIQYRSLTRRPVIRISSRQHGDNIVFEVSDNGLGMDLQKHRSHLFKLYKRFHSHTPGKGLGLFLVKQQLEKLNAKIEVDSVPDQGTTFRIFHQVVLSR